MTCGQGLWTKDWHNSLCALIIKKGAWETTTPTAAETSCKNHFSFIQKYYACKMLTNYAGMKLLSAAKKKQYLVIESRPPCSFKTGHFTSFIGRERLKCTKLKNARAKRAILLIFIVKYTNLRPSRLPSRPGYFIN